MLPGDDNAPATKKDLRELEARLGGVEERLAGMEERLVERMRDMQTEVLRAFHGWARPTEIKFRSQQDRLNAQEERLTLLEERLRELERSRMQH